MRTAFLPLAIAASAALPLRAQTPDAPGPLLSATRPGFEAYAPTPPDLQRAVAAAEQAAREYERYFGAPPARFALVAYETPEQRTAYADSAFRARGVSLIHWPVRSSVPGALTAWAELGVVFGTAPGGRPQVRALYPGGPLAGASLRVGDVVATVNGEAVASPQELRARRRALAVGAPVVLGVEREGARTEIRFTQPEHVEGPPPRETMGAAVAAAPKVPTSQETLAHEVGHLLLRARFQGRTLPAWFHEGFASLMEGSERRAAMRAIVRDVTRRKIALDTLLTMAHPASGGTVVRNPGEAGGPVRVVVAGGANAPGGDMFYAQSMSFLEFLARERGPRAVGDLAEKLAAGQNLAEALGGDRDVGAIEREWLAWLRTGEN